MILCVHSVEKRKIPACISHLLGNCCAIAEKRYEFFGRYFLGTGDLRQEHWSILLRFAKNLQKVSITLGLIRGCALGPLEASALGDKRLPRMVR